MEKSVEQEIADVRMRRPHVVILGAGASIASFLKGDRNGKKLPSMLNFVEVLELAPLLDSAGISHIGRNFEDIYDEMHGNARLEQVRTDLESRVFQYFDSLEISESPTIYDHLVLSLRETDVIATFNWDPFLIQAFRRNARSGRGFKLPRLQFLHGNVAAGFCPKDRVLGAFRASCSRCGNPFERSRLLFPIRDKHYKSDSFIAEQWSDIHESLSNAFMITVFGYGAPSSDVAAVELMKAAWGSPDERFMEQTEVIDIREEDDLRSTWGPFIHSHHYETHRNFYESWIAKHPRRTGEAYLSQYIDALFISDNPIPRDLDFPELWDWFEQFKSAEDH